MSKDLPNRWTRKGGAIYYRPTDANRHLWDGKYWFRLGKSESEAWATWNNRVVTGPAASKNVSKLIDQWISEHVNNRKRVRPATSRQYLAGIKNIRPVFGHMDVDEIKRVDIKRYYMSRFDSTQSGAVKELQTISAFLSWSMDQDLIEANPALKLNVPKGAPRTHYVEDYDIRAFSAFTGDLLNRYIPLKIYTGARKNDILNLKVYDWREEGLFIGDRKSYRALTGTKKLGRLYERNDELAEIMDIVLSDCGSEYIFETRDGAPYINFEKDTTDGFDSVWQRAKQRALKSGEMKQCFDESKDYYMDYNEARARKVPLIFQERDLRAKTATDSPDIISAQARLGHSSAYMTQRVYNRKPVVIKG